MSDHDFQLVAPDYEFDGIVESAGGVDYPCDVLVWLPIRPEDDAKVEITLRRNAIDADLRNASCIRSAANVNDTGLIFTADVVQIRSGTSNPRLSNTARLALTHIGLIRIEHVRVTKTDSAASNTSTAQDSVPLAYFEIVVSPLKYGAPHATTKISKTVGIHFVDRTPLKRLEFQSASATYAFELDRQWAWKTLDRTACAYGASAPALNLVFPNGALLRGQVSDLTNCGEDACALLSLAARHRVVPHLVRYAGADFRVEEWRYPLQRQRSITEEEATGPLISPGELEAYFACASKWFSALDATMQDAVRLAIFGIHRLSNSTMESHFIAMFAALEGLAKRLASVGHLSQKFDAMLKQYPVTAAGLWPAFGDTGGVPLYWFRNEIAHGRSVMKFSDALVIANDHLQLWLENILLALMGYKRTDVTLDWLSSQVKSQAAQISALRTRLDAQSKAAKP